MNRHPTREGPMKRISEVAGEIGVSAGSLRRWSRAGLIAELRSPGGQRYWSDEMVGAIRRAMAGRAGRDHVGRLRGTATERG